MADLVTPQIKQNTAIGGSGGPAFGIHTSHRGPSTIFGGGLPVVVRGQTVEGVGASSGTPDQDRGACQAGLDALLTALEGAPGRNM